MVRIIALCAALIGSAAAAQTPSAPPAPSASDLALGRDIAAKILPDGSYQRVMGGAMAKMMDGITSQMTDMPLAPLLSAAGLSARGTAKLDRTTIRQIMDIVDPAYDQRRRVAMPVIMTEMGKVMTQFEPAMRDGLAHAYATHFTSAQLSDIDRFFNTPSGAVYAFQNMTIAADPVLMQKMQAFLPAVMQAMPAIMAKVKAATDALPKPKTAQMLTPADRATLDRLLGVSAAKADTPSAAPRTDGRTKKSAPDMAAMPVGEIGQFFGSDNYPPAAIRAESQGRVVAALAIDPGGRVVSCAIESSSGSGVLDATTCAIATDRMIFDPATDHQGHAVAGQFRLPVRWVLPHNAPAVPVDATATTAPSH